MEEIWAQVQVQKELLKFGYILTYTHIALEWIKCELHLPALVKLTWKNDFRDYIKIWSNTNHFINEVCQNI